MASPNVVIVRESPFSRRDERRFGVETLLSQGFEVELWDVSRIYLPPAVASHEQPPDLVTPQILNVEEDLAARVTDLAPESTLIAMSGTFGMRLSHSGTAFDLLRLSRGALGTVYAGELARVPHDPSISRFRNIAGGVRRHVESGAGKILSAVESRLNVSRRLDWAWVGTSTNAVRPRLLGKETRIRYIHNLDYDAFQASKCMVPVIDGPYIAFLHALGPSSPDRALFGIQGSSSVKDYLETLRKVLNQIESTTGMPVVVAAHPRTEIGVLEEAMPGRLVVYGQSASVIRQSTRVLAVNYSTALNFVVLAKRPLTLLRSPVLQDLSRIDGDLDLLTRLLLCENLDVSDEVSQPPKGIVHERAYLNYKAQFIKKAGSPEIPFWDVVAGDLRFSW